MSQGGIAAIMRCPGTFVPHAPSFPTGPLNDVRRLQRLSLPLRLLRSSLTPLFTLVALLASAIQVLAQEEHVSEASLKVPPLNDPSIASFTGNLAGSTLLMGGLVVCVLGMLFGLWIYKQLQNAPVHPSMLEISELIYAT